MPIVKRINFEAKNLSQSQKAVGRVGAIDSDFFINMISLVSSFQIRSLFFCNQLIKEWEGQTYSKKCAFCLKSAYRALWLVKSFSILLHFSLVHCYSIQSYISMGKCGTTFFDQSEQSSKNKHDPIYI